VEEENYHTEFSKSKSWFDEFKLRTEIHLVESHGQSASANIQAKESYASKSEQIIKELGYNLKQVFNNDETWLF
jgi:hypothetical protein